MGFVPGGEQVRTKANETRTETVSPPPGRRVARETGSRMHPDRPSEALRACEVIDGTASVADADQTAEVA